MNSKLLWAAAVVALSGVGTTATVHAAQSNIFRPTILEAIDSPTGEARKEFSANEQWVKLARQKLGTDGPVTMVAKVTKRWQREGCATVESKFTFHNARFDEKKRDLVSDTMTMNVNTCRDGQPPVESMDLRDVKQTMGPESQDAVSPIPERRLQAAGQPGGAKPQQQKAQAAVETGKMKK